MSQEHIGPYDKDKCHFCNKSDKTHPTQDSRNVAGYQRAEDHKSTGPFFDACEECARKPYPKPKQFEEKEEIAA